MVLERFRCPYCGDILYKDEEIVFHVDSEHDVKVESAQQLEDRVSILGYKVIERKEIET